MNPTVEHRTAQTLEGIAKIAKENAEIGGTVLWMGGMDIGPILDEAVERERVRSSVEFARRIMDLNRIIQRQAEKIVELKAAVDKLHEREIADGKKIGALNALTRKVVGMLQACGVTKSDMGRGIDEVITKYHAMVIGATP